MAYYFARLEVGYPDPLTRPQDQRNSWRVYVLCTGRTTGSSTTRADVQACQSATDQASMRSAFMSLLNRAVTGQSLTDLYDVKTCHEAFEYLRQGMPTKVWRIRNGNVRLYFIYVSPKRIILLKTSVKRTQKLSKAEENEIIELADATFGCIDAHTFEGREINE